MSESNRDGGDDTSDESVEEEEDEEEDERISVRMPPPNFSRTAKSPPIISVSVPRKARSGGSFNPRVVLFLGFLDLRVLIRYFLGFQRMRKDPMKIGFRVALTMEVQGSN